MSCFSEGKKIKTKEINLFFLFNNINYLFFNELLNIIIFHKINKFFIFI